MEKKIAFLHIPKAAGSTFRTTIFDALGAQNVAWMNENITREKLLSISKEELSRYAVVGGHFTYSEISPVLGNNFHYFAVMREPIERAISAHNYVMRRPDHPLYARICHMSMRDAMKHVIDFRREVSNYQCHYLSETGSRSAMHAVRSILSNGIKVYTLKNYHEMIETIGSILNLSAEISIKNANMAPAGSYDREEYSDPALLEDIRKINKEDIWLYNSLLREAEASAHGAPA